MPQDESTRIQASILRRVPATDAATRANEPWGTTQRPELQFDAEDAGIVANNDPASAPEAEAGIVRA